MREIKFRAWEKHLKEMIAIESINFKTRLVNFDEVWRMFDEVELMQYTGLKDKNGVEIYEGDFLEDSLYVRWCDKQGGFQAWLPDDYCLACGGDMHWYEVVEQPERYEVIGNIYENPELLK